MPGPAFIPGTKGPASVGGLFAPTLIENDIHDEGTVTIVVTPSAAEAIADAGTVTAVVTPSGADALADSGTGTVVVTPSEAEAEADSGTATVVVTPSGSDAISDSGTVTIVVTPLTGKTLIDCGFEAQSLADDAEGAGYRVDGAPVIDTAVAYAGAASLRADPAGNTGAYWLQDGAPGDGPARGLDIEYRLRMRFRVAGNPVTSAFVRIFSTTSIATLVMNLRIAATREIQARNRSGGAIGQSAPVTANAWHLIEVIYKVVSGGGTNSPVELWVDGVQAFASTLADLGAVAPKRIAVETGSLSQGVAFYWDSISESSQYGEAIADSGTGTAVVTPSGSEAISDSGTVTIAASVTGSEAIADSGTATIVASPSASEAIADAGAVTVVVASSGSDALAEAGGMTVAVDPTEGEAEAETGAVTITFAASSAEAISDAGTATASVVPSSSEGLADTGDAGIAAEVSGNEAITDVGAVAVSVALSGDEVLADSGIASASVSVSADEAVADEGTEDIITFAELLEDDGTATISATFSGDGAVTEPVEPPGPPAPIPPRHPPVAPITRVQSESRARVSSTYRQTVVVTSTTFARTRSTYLGPGVERKRYATRLRAESRWRMSATLVGRTSTQSSTIAAVVRRQPEGPAMEEELILLGLL